jgi:hypothetical protein
MGSGEATVSRIYKKPKYTRFNSTQRAAFVAACKVSGATLESINEAHGKIRGDAVTLHATRDAMRTNVPRIANAILGAKQRRQAPPPAPVASTDATVSVRIGDKVRTVLTDAPSARAVLDLLVAL